MKLIKNNSFIKSFLVFNLIILGLALEAKKEYTMMEYMNSFYSGDKKAETVIESSIANERNHNSKNALKEHGLITSKGKRHKKHKLKLKSRKNINSYRFSQLKSSNSTTSNTSATSGCSLFSDMGYNQTLKLNSSLGKILNETFPEPTGGIFIEGELFISAEVFKNRERFPSIIMPNGTVENIEINSDNFRINKQNCENSGCNLNFWFRLAPQLHLYYASTEKDLNVLGSVLIKNLVKVSDPLSPIITSCGEAFCFELEDVVDSNWKLCAKTWERAYKWICAIKKELGIKDPTCETGKKEELKIIEKQIKEPIVIIPTPSRFCNEAWNYQQHGEDWECECKEGVEQSPIDLPKKNDAIDSPVRPLYGYKEILASSTIDTIDQVLQEDRKIKIQLFKNALRIFHHNLGKVTTIDGAVYYAEEIVFHSPAQHTIEGKTFDMEIEIIHYGKSVGDISKQLTLNFLVEKKPGIYNKFFDDLDIFNLPDSLNREKDINNNLFIPKLLFRSDDNDMPMMKAFSFYTYQGSLTSPPCNERTIVYVASKPIRLSNTVVSLFQESLRIPDLVDPKGNVIVSDWLPQSNRKVQEKNGRPVFYYDHEKYCGPDPIHKPPTPKGHYEKVQQKAINYFFVNGEKPSGLPGSFVVTEGEAKGSDFKDLQANN